MLHRMTGLTGHAGPHVPRERRRPRAHVLTALAASFALLGGAACTSQVVHGAGHQSHLQAVRSGILKDAQLIRGNAGWALSSDALSLTTNDGRTWTVITPPGVSARAILGVSFLDAKHGWVVSFSASNNEQLQISATANGGTTWSTSPLGDPSDVFTAASLASVDFVDGQHGWVAVTIGSPNGGISPEGTLFRTTDGGATWQTLQMPVGGPVEFVSSTTGWTADGFRGESNPQFYVTTDGGQGWTPETVPPPSGFTQSQAGYTIPSFASPANVVLAAFDDGSKTTAGFYETSDSGASWTLKATVPSGTSGADVSPSATAVDGAAWIAVAINESALTEVTMHGGKTVGRTPAGLPANSGVSDISFTSTGNTGVGWGIVGAGQCAGFKTGCTQTSDLYGTTDGGADWAKISVP